MLKKLVALLLATLLFIPAALADTPNLLDFLSSLGSLGSSKPDESLSEEQRLQIIYEMMNAELDAENIQYETVPDQQGSYYSLLFESETPMGDRADIDMLAYWDGVAICASYRDPIADEHFDEIVRFCNLMNSSLYIGKLYLCEYADGNYLCYEVFLPMDAAALNDYDRYSVMEYAYFSAQILEVYQEYFMYVLEGETAANAYAMWYADAE